MKLPGSKSLSNRILLLAALSKGTTLVKNLLVRSDACLLLLSLSCSHRGCSPARTKGAEGHLYDACRTARTSGTWLAR